MPREARASADVLDRPRNPHFWLQGATSDRQTCEQQEGERASNLKRMRFRFSGRAYPHHTFYGLPFSRNVLGQSLAAPQHEVIPTRWRRRLAVPPRTDRIAHPSLRRTRETVSFGCENWCGESKRDIGGTRDGEAARRSRPPGGWPDRGVAGTVWGGTSFSVFGVAVLLARGTLGKNWRSPDGLPRSACAAHLSWEKAAERGRRSRAGWPAGPRMAWCGPTLANQAGAPRKFLSYAAGRSGPFLLFCCTASDLISAALPQTSEEQHE